MSKNKQTTSVADALDAAELTAPRAFNIKASKTVKQSTKGGAVDTVPPIEASPVVQTTASNDEDEPTSENTPSLSSEIHRITPEQLKLNPLSDNIYGSDVPAALRASITENGITTPLIVARASMRVISGNTRLRVAQQLSMEKVSVLFIETQMTEEEEQNLVLSYNVARTKTNEMRVREYRGYLAIEKELAKRRLGAPRRGKTKVQNFSPSKSREIAAQKVGISHTSLETGVKVVETIDRLLEQGESNNAKRLREVLEDKGYSPAKNLALNQKWLNDDDTEKTNKAGQRAKSSQKQPQAEKTEPLLDSILSDIEPEGTSLEAASDSTSMLPAAEAPIHSPVVEFSKVEAAFEQMSALEAFLRDVDASQLTDEVRTKIGLRIGGINAAALAAGFKIKAI